MKLRIMAVVAALAICTTAQAAAKASHEVQASKGQLQLKLQVQSTRVKATKSLWYKIELKNIGKKQIQLFDDIFRSPHAIHVNSRLRRGIYVEIFDPSGKPVHLQSGNYRVRYDWEGPEGTDYLYTPQEKKELIALIDEWKRSGMTAQQQSMAESAWVTKLMDKKNAAELTDPAKRRWLAPGASTTAVAWSDRGPGDYPGRSDDDKSLSRGYAELWTHPLYRPGTYRIRVVYDYLNPESQSKHPAFIKFKTPFLEFKVLP